MTLATGVLTELARLREENEELRSKGAAVAENWVGKGWKGPAALLQAPYDLFVVFSIKAKHVETTHLMNVDLYTYKEF